ncbi:hypothetical protein JIN85_17925 [Luteolibacter pohnpeiensis]|uniref:Uncharacterized protein n=1 Tax=Luteolibacter pohnpeiensis TaxID=454153 RepID=A0A934VXX3_9BACT|nr:hypothetical protein [Luteolibacter pohnpeiensis]MBK1884303.1 hypothetical protein [Luteolibacter pohnpeiensis]
MMKRFKLDAVLIPVALVAVSVFGFFVGRISEVSEAGLQRESAASPGPASQLDSMRPKAAAALAGDLLAAQELFEHYSYGTRDYERSYFWAVVCEENGYDTKFGSLVEIARDGIIAEYGVEPADVAEPNQPSDRRLPD